MIGLKKTLPRTNSSAFVNFYGILNLHLRFKRMYSTINKLVMANKPETRMNVGPKASKVSVGPSLSLPMFYSGWLLACWSISKASIILSPGFKSSKYSPRVIRLSS